MPSRNPSLIGSGADLFRAPQRRDAALAGAVKLVSIIALAVFLFPPAILAAGPDCNRNGADDAADIAAGKSADCNANGIPDECEVRSLIDSFQTAAEIPLDPVPGAVRAADIDGDGDDDLVVLGRDYLVTFFNRGTGSPVRGEKILIPTSQFILQVFDADGDTDLDLATLDEDSDRVTIIANQGRGIFRVQDRYALGISRMIPVGAAVVDYDLDGDPDIAVAGRNSMDLTLLFNDGRGVFSGAINIPLGREQRSIQSADLDGDGHTDLVIGAVAAIILLRHSGILGFTAPVLLESPGRGTFTAVVGDVDGDDRLDIITSAISIHLNDGRGNFPDSMDVGKLGDPRLLLPVDLDGDGALDLVASDPREFLLDGLPDQRVAVLWNDGTGKYPRQENLIAGSTPASMAAVNIAAGEGPELAIVNREAASLSIIEFLGRRPLNAPGNYLAGDGPGKVIPMDFDRDGRIDLAVANSRSGDVTILRNTGNGIFSAHRTYPIGGVPFALAAADLDGDMLEDLAVNGPSTALTVLRNTGNLGDPFAAIASQIGGGARWIALGDFDGDRFQDLAATNASLKSITVLYNVGAGRFGRSTNLALESEPGCVAAADVDADGDMDIVAGMPGKFSILRNRDQESFEARRDVEVLAEIRSIQPVDLDGDGVVDFASATSAGPMVLWGEDGGGIQARSYNAGSLVTDVIAVDLDRDGLADMAGRGGRRPERSLFILRNEGSRSFRLAGFLPAGKDPESLASADFDGDGAPDLASANFASDDVTVILNRNAGSGERDCNANGIPDGCELAGNDCDGDGVLDACLGPGDGIDFVMAGGFLVQTPLNSLAVADLDGDRHPDLAATGIPSDAVSVLLGDGSGGFVRAAPIPVKKARGIAAADLDGDGDFDLAVTSDEGKAVPFFNAGGGTFQAAGSHVVGAEPRSIVVADLDGDNRPDLATANYQTTDISILRSLGAANYSGSGSVFIGIPVVSIRAADMDGDGDNDLIALNRFSSVSIALNRGDGTFSPPYQAPVGSDHSSFAIEDLNGDRHLDIVVASKPDGAGDLSWIRNRGNGTFEPPLEVYSGGVFPFDVVVADLDADGDPDLAAAGVDCCAAAPATILVLRNLGAGVFSPGETFAAAGGLSIAAADFDSDGDIDLVSGSSELRPAITLLLNRTPRQSVLDCNFNRIPDACEIRADGSKDRDGDGILDACENRFIRGDANVDGAIEISDPVFILGFLFLGDPARLDCRRSSDANDDGALDIADPLYLLDHLFLGGPGIGAPFPFCGTDPTFDRLDCESFSSCR